MDRIHGFSGELKKVYGEKELFRREILDSCRWPAQGQGRCGYTGLLILPGGASLSDYIMSAARCPIRKVFHFESPRERYTSDAAIVWCFDHRFDLVLRKLTRRIGVVYFDPILVAGGAKCLAGDDSESDRQFVLEQIRKSMRLHGTETVLLMLHSDCGAYGGLAAFENDPVKEAENHRNDMHRAIDFLQTAIPELTVRGFFVDFEGVWEADSGLGNALSA